MYPRLHGDDRRGGEGKKGSGKAGLGIFLDRRGSMRSLAGYGE